MANMTNRVAVELRWVSVTDAQGRQRTEMRWTATAADPARSAMVKAA